MSNKKKKNTRVHTKANVYDYLIWISIIILAIFTLYPFIYTIAGSFNEGQDYLFGGVWLYPRKFTLANYKIVFGDYRFWLALRNTFLRTVIGTTVAILFTSCVAYGMSQKHLRFKKFFRVVNIITLFFSGGLVPYYLMINLVGLYDSFLVYIIPTMYSVYNMIIFSVFFRGIPEEIHEAAVMDGANEFRIWWSIYMPNSKPVLATVGLWVIVGHWNSYMPTLLFTSRGEDMWTLQYYLMRIIRDSSMPEGLDGVLSSQITPQTVSLAAMVVTMLPMILLFPFLQKFFAKGALGGSLKQ